MHFQTAAWILQGNFSHRHQSSAAMLSFLLLALISNFFFFFVVGWGKEHQGQPKTCKVLPWERVRGWLFYQQPCVGKGRQSRIYPYRLRLHTHTHAHIHTPKWEVKQRINLNRMTHTLHNRARYTERFGCFSQTDTGWFSISSSPLTLFPTSSYLEYPYHYQHLQTKMCLQSGCKHICRVDGLFDIFSWCGAGSAWNKHLVKGHHPYKYGICSKNEKKEEKEQTQYVIQVWMNIRRMDCHPKRYRWLRGLKTGKLRLTQTSSTHSAEQNGSCQSFTVIDDVFGSLGLYQVSYLLWCCPERRWCYKVSATYPAMNQPISE